MMKNPATASVPFLKYSMYNTRALTAPVMWINDVFNVALPPSCVRLYAGSGLAMRLYLGVATV
ncbi:hypothetical protein Pogu_2269 [Pyrobaculum oguniense TE7]|uniref:Uncharacterized protein n=1 Tax=Pyrobaculum oguniense (strain DSM 13380 / JCM 10595 / TE7) TaxID=698757 RepID=H6QD28_PYROT|nr:hypothetical protein Pogu_2269 [Pyrobaculum oguniense TE7]